ncbi:BgTH12-04501 [Blumeria graminis f. sp. triticale]|uniref:Bgt-55138 n=2 Tax=Blumeria graminis TaxID=34373 RepID=A0A9X9L7R9_BLUGR|nr:BgTH12-04501 [Blumeria graminis f. sp. triticale]VCU38950.1 Bgt-55138 [Blumeria graminis f. sp. tritici]
MKLNIGLTTLAISSLVSAYCMKSILQPTLQPTLKPTFVESQEAILSEEYIPGKNHLEYCSKQKGDEPLDLLEINIDPIDPDLNEWNQVEIFGFLYEPLTPGTYLRITDSMSGRVLVRPIEIFEYMETLGIEPPRDTGVFHMKFYLLPETHYLATKKITLQLYDRNEREFFCVKSPVQAS